MNEFTTAAYQDIAELIENHPRGCRLTLETYGKAVNFRQRIYKYRKAMNSAGVATNWDDLIVVVKPGEKELSVQKRDNGIVSIEGVAYSEWKQEQEKPLVNPFGERFGNMQQNPTGNNPENTEG